MANFAALQNRKNELIRKALEGAVFVAPISAPAITVLTQEIGSASAGTILGSANAVNIVTGGNLVLSRDNQPAVTVALLAADTPASVVTKINTAMGYSAASLVSSKLQLVSSSTGVFSSIKVVSGTGTVLANLFLVAGQEGLGSSGGVDLVPLNVAYGDLGWLDGGVQVSRDVAASEMNSWGSSTPTRTDITSDTTSMTVVCQETKALTIGIGTGADMSTVIPDPATGEVRILKPARPKSKHYRVLSVGVDEGDGGEIYIARHLPRGKVSSYAEQTYDTESGITWGVTFVGEVDSDLGYSESWFFGGPGWEFELANMGF